jgi:hypothetical protein
MILFTPDSRAGRTRARAALLLVGTQLAACSATTQPSKRPDTVFLQAFESTQLPPGEGEKGSWELILVRRDDEGMSHVFRAGAEGMDRLVYVWGEKGPAVPIFFSPEGAMTFTLYQTSVHADDTGLSAAALDERAWRKFRESAEKKKPEAKEQQ